MVQIGDTFDHEEYGEVEILEAEERLTMTRQGHSELREHVKFLPLDRELAQENIEREPMTLFETNVEEI